ncbi:MAG: hypothetical protein R3E88_19020 [Myxococcota bacterium]
MAAAAPAARAARPDRACEETARFLYKSCRLETNEDMYVEFAKCENLSEGTDRKECRDDAAAERRALFEECAEVRDEREQICEDLGETRYDPQLDPADFVAGVSNPYTPFTVGSVWTYQKQTSEGLEEIVFEILPDTRDFDGIVATSIRDRVTLDGVVVEDTTDWVAQDVDGNVWYLGEIAQNFEDGRLADLSGSWEIGKEGAKPGFWMIASPQVGQFYRQEWLPGDAEDMVEVISVDATGYTFPFANGSPVLQTRDYLPSEPGKYEYKFYVPGVGMVLEVDPETGEELRLIDYQP